MRKHCSGLMVLFVYLISTQAGGADSEEIVRQIRELYAQTNEIIKNNNVEDVELYSEAGKDGYEIKGWHIASESPKYEVGAYDAHLFIDTGRVIKTRVELQSLSGDWSYLTEYYYYPNGNVAFIFESNTTYNGYVIRDGKKLAPDGPFIVEKRTYLEQGGKTVRFLKKAFLQQTSEIVPVEQIQNIEPVKFGAVCSLPFIELVRKRLENCRKGKS